VGGLLGVGGIYPTGLSTGKSDDVRVEVGKGRNSKRLSSAQEMKGGLGEKSQRVRPLV